jgi:hypothetical protein
MPFDAADLPLARDPNCPPTPSARKREAAAAAKEGPEKTRNSNAVNKKGTL